MSPSSFGTREGRHPAQRTGKQRRLRASHPSQALPGPHSASLSWGPSHGLQASGGCADRKLQVPWRADSYPNPKLARVSPSRARAARLGGHEWAEKFPCPEQSLPAPPPQSHDILGVWAPGEQASHVSLPPIHAAETTEAPVPLVTLLSALCRFYDPAGPENKEEGSIGVL